MILRFSLKSPMFFHWQTVLHDPPIEEIWSFREPPQGRAKECHLEADDKGPRRILPEKLGFNQQK